MSLRDCMCSATTIILHLVFALDDFSICHGVAAERAFPGLIAWSIENFEAITKSR